MGYLHICRACIIRANWVCPLTITLRQAGYIPPKRAYSFEAMLDDILDFGYDMLVDDGRLCMWMPTANDEETEIAIPTHPAMELISVSVQQFNKCILTELLKHSQLRGSLHWL